ACSPRCRPATAGRSPTMSRCAWSRSRPAEPAMADQGRLGRERDRALAGPSGWRMRTRLVLLLAAVAALLFATLIAQLVMQDQQRDLRNLVLDNLDPAELALSDIRAGLADQETSLRGVALTRDPRFVESYEEGAEITRTALGRLDAL